MSKFLFSILSVLILPMVSFAQEVEKEQSTVLDSPAGWRLEIIEFPLGFAQSIGYEGFEEIRFAPKWNDSSSSEFWAYSFVWYLDDDAKISSDILIDQMKAYYNGIMEIDSTRASFIELNDGSYVGSVRTHDKFFTKKEIVLNLRMKAQYCSKTDKYTYLFHITKLPFDDPIWGKLKNVKLSDKCD